MKKYIKILDKSLFIYYFINTMLQKIFSKKSQTLSLKEYMEKNKLSRRELSRILGITESYLSYYFSGKRKFGAQTALRISDITGIPVENLIR
jgi:predicted transcriptional regulator